MQVIVALYVQICRSSSKLSHKNRNNDTEKDTKHEFLKRKRLYFIK